MRRHGLAGLLAGAAILLVGQYLAWAEPQAQPVSDVFSGPGGATAGLPNLFTTSSTVGGWGIDAAVFSVLLLVLATRAFARPEVVDELPLGFASLGACFCVVANAVLVRRVVDFYRGETGVHYQPAAGAFVTAAGGVVVLAAVGYLRRGRLRTPGRLRELATPLLAAALLASLLLPWQRISIGPNNAAATKGVEEPGAFAVIVLALVLVARLRPAGLSARASRLVVPAATAVLAVGLGLPTTLGYVPTYGAWVGVCLAAGLVAAALLLDGTWPPDVDRARLWPFAIAAGAAVLLFLPWTHACYPSTDFGRLSGRCYTAHGVWTPSVATVLLAGAWAVGAGAPRIARVELAVAAAILVSTIGFDLYSPDGGVGVSVAWGAVLSLVVAGLLVVPVLARAVAGISPAGRLDLRLAPVALCTAYLAVVVVPWWDVLPRSVEDAVEFAGPSWLTIPCVAAVIRLARLWWEREPGDGRAGRLTFLPLFVLALAVAEVVSEHQSRPQAIGWGEGVVLTLGAALTLAGWVEERGGLERFEVPAILRIDRI